VNKHVPSKKSLRLQYPFFLFLNEGAGEKRRGEREGGRKGREGGKGGREGGKQGGRKKVKRMSDHVCVCVLVTECANACTLN